MHDTGSCAGRKPWKPFERSQAKTFFFFFFFFFFYHFLPFYLNNLFLMGGQKKSWNLKRPMILI